MASPLANYFFTGKSNYQTIATSFLSIIMQDFNP